MDNQVVRLWENGVEAEIASLMLTMTNAVVALGEAAVIVVKGFNDAILCAQWQWKFTDTMQGKILSYRATKDLLLYNGMTLAALDIPKHLILKQRRYDRRHRFPSLFMLDRMAR